MKLAVLGGGMGSLAAVYELTRDPEVRKRYEITVYQLGFRLGGKGASGHRQGDDRRIEEHGLHVIFGASSNLVGMMRDVYAEWSTARGTQVSFDDMLLALPSVTFLEPEHAPASRWRVDFPPNDLPPLRDAGDVDMSVLYTNLLRMFRITLGRAIREVRRARAIDAVRSSASLGFFVWARSLSAVLRWAQSRPLRDTDQLRRLLDRLRPLATESWTFVEKQAYQLPEVRRFAVALDLSLAIATGMAAHGLTSPAFDAAELDEEDFRAWLRRHGAREITLRSTLVRGLYDAAFTKEDEYGAGTLLQIVLWMFAYRGHVAYYMRDDMGTTIFAPLYEVLRKRGVRFEFFHRVEALRADDAGRVTRIEMSQQAQPLDGRYDPLIRHDGVPSWPTQAKLDQLRDAAALAGVDFENHWQRAPSERAITLHQGSDFDHVLLGISLGALPALCEDLAAKDARLRTMFERVPTRPTLGLQLWTASDPRALGWERDVLTIGHPSPIDTCADMSHLLPREGFAPSDAPGGLFYLCTGLVEREPPAGPEDAHYPERLLAHARAHVEAHLDKHARELWPHWQHRGSRPSEARTYIHVPKNPSDRYVPATVGTTRFRLRADESGFDNLTLAGDWTRTLVNAGAVEAACASGRFAARVLGAPVGLCFGETPELRAVWDVPVEQRRRLVTPLRGPRYIVRDGDHAPAARYVSRDSRMSTFWLRSDEAALARLCDRQLNLGGPYEYRPLGGLAALVAADCRAMAPLEGRDRDAGTARERDIGFWIPVVKGRVRGGRFEPLNCAFFIPYIWVDNYLGLLGGREVFGFPKQMGLLTMPEAPGDRAYFEVRAAAVEHISPGATTELPIVCARRSDRERWDDAAGAVVSATQWMRSLLGMLQSGGTHALEPRVVASLTEIAQSGVVPMVFLKQLPDPSDCEVAAYQAVVEAESRVVGSVRGAGLLSGQYEVEVHEHTGCHVARELGLHGTKHGHSLRTVSLAQYWVQMDFTIERARVVFRAC